MLQSETPDAANRAPDPHARRCMAILCIIYLVLLVTQLIAFASTDFAAVRDCTEDAAADLSRAEASRAALVVEHDDALLEQTSAQQEYDDARRRRDNARDDGNATEVQQQQIRLDAARPLLESADQSVAMLRTRFDELDQVRMRHDDIVDAHRRGWARVVGLLLTIGVVGYFVVIQRRRISTRAEVITNVTVMITAGLVLLVASRLVFQKVIPNLVTWGLGGQVTENQVLRGLADIVVANLVACLIMPWRVRESVYPFAIPMLAWGLTALVPGTSEFGLLDRVVGVIVSPIVLVPGAMIAGFRARRRQEDAERHMYKQQVRSLGGELSRARIVHDAMFPDPCDTGHVSFEYEYQPIAEIGGDYVHLHTSDDGTRLSLTLLDVAGHGLAAALTVNRLFGELERIRAEDADATPADVVTLLNRYIYLTMTRHDLYATGMCMQLDVVSGELTWVTAGHPPAFLRHSNGDVSELACTTVLLGALPPKDFSANPMTTSLTPGDCVIAYTDGAFEARNVEGHCFGLDSLRRTARFSPPPRSWPKFIASAVANHHSGCADDDILIASLTLRSLGFRVPADAECHTTGSKARTATQ